MVTICIVIVTNVVIVTNRYSYIYYKNVSSIVILCACSYS